MAIVRANDITVVEGTGSFFQPEGRFRLTLDEPATAPVIVRYAAIGRTADPIRDFGGITEGAATFQVGEQELFIEAAITGDALVEGDEFFDLIVINGQNAEFEDGAAGLRVRATILDNDDADPDGPGGETDTPATPIFGPDPQPGVLPTLSIRDRNIRETDRANQDERFVVVLDRPAIADVTLSWYTEGVTATRSADDFEARNGFVTIEAGQQAAFIATRLTGDDAAEGTESFNLIVTGVVNAVLPGGGAALRVEGTILDDDGNGALPEGGEGDFAEVIQGPPPVPGDLPTLRVQDVAVIEGNTSLFSQVPYARFLLTLDRPAQEDVTLQALMNNGTATAGLGDFTQLALPVTIRAGQQSAFVSSQIPGDIEIEGDETFTLAVTNLQGARFENGAAALLATATIRDDDSGALTGVGGIGGAARGVRPPEPGPGGTVTVAVHGTSLGEADAFEDFAFVYVVLSEPAPGPVSLRFDTRDGSAEAGADFDATAGTLVVPQGVQSAWVRVNVNGDTAPEGDERFAVVFSEPTGAVFAGGGATATAEVLIRGDDGLGTAGIAPTGPDFDFLPDPVPPLRGTGGADDLRGGSEDEAILGLGGNDTLVGGGGDDTLTGGGGRDAFAFLRRGDMGVDTITDFDDRDILALDDRFFGKLAGNGVDPRQVTQDQARSALASGSVDYDRATGAFSVGGEVIAVIEGGPRLTFEDVFLF